jgi:ferredoxin
MAGQANRSWVTLIQDDRRVGRFDAGPDQSVLAATDAAALDMEYGCRDGSCVRCIARLLDGEVRYQLEPSALTEEQRDAGFVLLCIAEPVSDCRFEIGRRVLEDAFPQLWPRESGFR